MAAGGKPTDVYITRSNLCMRQFWLISRSADAQCPFVQLRHSSITLTWHAWPKMICSVFQAYSWQTSYKESHKHHSIPVSTDVKAICIRVWRQNFYTRNCAESTWSLEEFGPSVSYNLFDATVWEEYEEQVNLLRYEYLMKWRCTCPWVTCMAAKQQGSWHTWSEVCVKSFTWQIIAT